MADHRRIGQAHPSPPRLALRGLSPVLRVLEVELADRPSGPMGLLEGPVDSRAQAPLPAQPHHLGDDVRLSLAVADPAVDRPIFGDSPLVELAVMVMRLNPAQSFFVRPGPAIQQRLNGPHPVAVPLTIHHAGQQPRHVIVRVSVPVAPGLLTGPLPPAVTLGEAPPTPAQAWVITRHPDGSARRVMLSFPAKVLPGKKLSAEYPASASGRLSPADVDRR